MIATRSAEWRERNPEKLAAYQAKAALKPRKPLDPAQRKIYQDRDKAKRLAREAEKPELAVAYSERMLAYGRNRRQGKADQISAQRAEHYARQRERLKADPDGEAAQTLREQRAMYHKAWNDRRRAALLALFGTKCNHCGITDPLVLQIDHVNSDGAEHRKRCAATGNGPRGYYNDIMARWDSGDFQCLCCNCNFRKRYTAQETNKGKRIAVGKRKRGPDGELTPALAPLWLRKRDLDTWAEESGVALPKGRPRYASEPKAVVKPDPTNNST